MYVTDIFVNEKPEEKIQIIRERCSAFIVESNGLPLYKNLPSSYPDFHKVKVRHGKQHDNMSKSMNLAFESQNKQFTQRAIFASGTVPQAESTNETFYIFPIDGFQFLYNTEVKEATDLKVFDSIFEQFGEKKGCALIADVLKFSYTTHNLQEGILHGSEIILYGIPFYYALRSSVVESYDTLLTSVLDL